MPRRKFIFKYIEVRVDETVHKIDAVTKPGAWRPGIACLAVALNSCGSCVLSESESCHQLG